MTDDRGQFGQSGQEAPQGQHGQAGDGQHDPWAPPEEKLSLHKTEPSVAGPSPSGPPAAGPPAGFGPPAGPAPYPGGPYGHQVPPSQPPGYGYGYAAYPGYGVPGVPGRHAPWATGPQPPGGTSTAAMVLGIIGLVLTLTCYGSLLAVFVSPVALGLGISARRKVAAGLQGGSGQANAGFIMGIIGLVLSLLVAVLLVIGMIAAYHDSQDDNPYNQDGGSSSYGAHGPVTTVVVTR